MSLTADLPGINTRRPRRNHATLRRMIFRALDAAKGGDVQVVQVGANDGRMADPLNEELRKGRWRGLMLEPHPDYFADLQKTYAGLERVACRNLGVSDAAGEMVLHHVRADAERSYPDWVRGCASLSRDRLMDALAIASRRTGVEVSEEDVQATPIRLDRLDAILAAEKIDRIDALVVDVEGHELPVLGSFDIAAAGLSVALVECNGANMPEQAEYVAAIEKAGLEVFRLGDDLVGLDPDKIAIPISDLMRWIGYAPLGASPDATATA